MDYLAINRDSWDKRTQVHLTSKFYDVEGFLRGDSSLKQIELSELGLVSGKKLLHLQCHFGLDTLSWARLGANVTGVDLSPLAIEKAQEIAAKCELPAEFICSDVYAFGEHAQAIYDVVFTSYGAICWLPDLNKWAETITRSLVPGGTFYIVDFHPVLDLVSGYSYFHSEEPDVVEEGTYTENCKGEESTLVSWGHPLSEIINALISAGIRIDMVNEFPYSPYDCFEGLEQSADGNFYLVKQGQDVPLVYSIRGSKK